MPTADDNYHAEDGSTTPLNTADAVDTSISLLSQRLLALETKPALGTGLATGDLEYRIARLEAVLVEYFFSQFQRYDADHPKPAATEPSTGGASGT